MGLLMESLMEQKMVQAAVVLAFAHLIEMAWCTRGLGSRLDVEMVRKRVLKGDLLLEEGLKQGSVHILTCLVLNCSDLECLSELLSSPVQVVGIDSPLVLVAALEVALGRLDLQVSADVQVHGNSRAVVLNLKVLNQSQMYSLRWAAVVVPCTSWEQRLSVARYILVGYVDRTRSYGHHGGHENHENQGENQAVNLCEVYQNRLVE